MRKAMTVAGPETQGAKQARWAKVISEWRHSGKSQRAFCHEHGLPLSSFRWWHRRLQRGEAGQPEVSFLPLRVSGANDIGGALVEIELRSGTRLRLAGEAALRAVDRLVARVR